MMSTPRLPVVCRCAPSRLANSRPLGVPAVPKKGQTRGARDLERRDADAAQFVLFLS